MGLALNRAHFEEKTLVMLGALVPIVEIGDKRPGNYQRFHHIAKDVFSLADLCWKQRKESKNFSRESGKASNEKTTRRKEQKLL